jgi:hypothetical protein
LAKYALAVRRERPESHKPLFPGNIIIYIFPLILLGFLAWLLWGLVVIFVLAPVIWILSAAFFLIAGLLYICCFQPIWIMQDLDIVAHIMWIEDRGTYYERVAVGEMSWCCWKALSPVQADIILR